MLKNVLLFFLLYFILLFLYFYFLYRETKMYCQYEDIHEPDKIIYHLQQCMIILGLRKKPSYIHVLRKNTPTLSTKYPNMSKVPVKAVAITTNNASKVPSVLSNRTKSCHGTHFIHIYYKKVWYMNIRCCLAFNQYLLYECHLYKTFDFKLT